MKSKKENTTLKMVFILSSLALSSCWDSANDLSRSAGLPVGYMPSSNDVKDIIHGKLTPDYGCDWTGNSDGRFGEGPQLTPVEGAWKVMAAKFQTCEALSNERGATYSERVKFKGYTPDYFEKRRKSGLYPPAGNCKDSLAIKKRKEMLAGKWYSKKLVSPVMYAQGWRTSRIRDGEMRVLEAASDCSSFVSAAFMASGLKMDMMATPAKYSTTTKKLNSDFLSGRSCFNMPSGSVNDVIRPGDIINTVNGNGSSGGHVAMIDRVGRDPFKIKEFSSQVENGEMSRDQAINRCRNLNQGEIDVSIIHSSTVKSAGHGITRIHLSKYYSRTASKFVIYARSMCMSYLKQDGLNKGFDASKGKFWDNNFLVLRHKGRGNPNCVAPTPRIQGEECIDQCYKDGPYQKEQV